MQTKYKELNLEIKDLNLEERTFTAVAAGIGNIDHGNDMFVSGAFLKTIEGRVAAGKVKFLDAHPYEYVGVPSFKYVMGKVISAEETETELLVKIYVSDTADGNDLLVKIKDGVLDALSVGYIVIDKELVKDTDGKIIRLLKEVKLMEVSAVIWGMNDKAVIDATSVKAISFDVALTESVMGDEFWNSNQAFQTAVRSILEDEELDDKNTALEEALNGYKKELVNILGLLSAEPVAESVDGEALYTIRANSVLQALLEAKVSDEPAGEEHTEESTPPGENKTNQEDVNKMFAVKERVNKMRIKQLKGVEQNA